VVGEMFVNRETLHTKFTDRNYVVISCYGVILVIGIKGKQGRKNEELDVTIP
jgi:hypothetical protein